MDMERIQQAAEAEFPGCAVLLTIRRKTGRRFPYSG